MEGSGGSGCLLPKNLGGDSMKKVIAILVVFALIAGAAFADTWMGGGFRAGWNVISNSGEEDAESTTNIGIEDTSFNIGGQSEDGVIGGNIRIRGWHNDSFSDWEWGGFGGSHFFAWWKPVPQVKVFLGRNPDGDFGYDGFVGWGFHEGGNDYGAIHGYDYGNGHAGGFSALGFYLALTPIDGLEIDFALPLSTEAELLEDAFKTVYIQASYDISGIGKAFFTYNGLGYVEDVNNGDIGFGFHLNAIEGIPVILLAKIGLPDGGDGDFGLSLGAAYYAGDFGVKFRVATTFKSDKDADFGINLNVMPFYNFGFMKGFLNLGFHVVNEDTSLFYLNPYIMKWIGGGTLSAGIQVDIWNNDGDSTTSFNLPIKIGYSF